MKAKDIALIGVAGIGIYALLQTETMKEQLGKAGISLPTIIPIEIPTILPFEVPTLTTVKESIVSAIPDISGIIPEMPNVEDIASSLVEGFKEKLPEVEVKGWTERVAESIGGGLANLMVGWIKPYSEKVFELGQDFGEWIRRITFPAWKGAYRGLQTQMIGAVSVPIQVGGAIGTGVSATVGGITGGVSKVIETVTGRGVSDVGLVSTRYGTFTEAQVSAQKTFEALTPAPFRKYIYG